LSVEQEVKQSRRESSRGTIVVADDERTVRDTLRAVLESREYEVVTADNGIRALELVREHRPDLLIVDILMPGMSGLEVCRQMHEAEDLGKIPIIVITSVTADSELPDAFWRMATESEEFITKPFDVFDLADRAERLIEKGRDTDQSHETPARET